jgi:RHH-type proline utilization regulon transcriptional repressor/proline dehydrogenase/delta 1-pyrroline-5-carboxylate dehydrogenase
MDSKHLQKALEYIESVKGQSLSFESREKKAVDLASEMLQEATKTQTHSEKRRQHQLARMMNDEKGKAFTTSMTDECFRSRASYRIADQLVYLMNSIGIPKYLSLPQQWQLKAFKLLAPFLAPVLIPLVTFTLRKETSSVILPGEAKSLAKHMKKRRAQGVRINLNHLGEAILGENEAKRRLSVYLEDLKNPDIEYISIKISTIFSQIHLIGWEETLEVLSDRLRALYRAAKTNRFLKADGSQVQKFVNLDMEEYRDLFLTKELFKRVLSEPEFLDFSAGIVLQAYLPDCFLIQKELTEWAKERASRGGAPIKIRIVKGANLSMEQFEASIKGWPQAPYKSKEEVDANYKKMVTFGCQKENAEAVHLGIGSHNLFDIAYAMILRAEYGVEKSISFEMLEGMADHIRRVVQFLTQDILLYCPVATKEDFQSAIAYLIRRLDENTGPDNFLRHTFGLKPDSETWKDQVSKFSKACNTMDSLFIGPRKTQNRFDKEPIHPIQTPFVNEPDTDFSLPINRKWAKEIAHNWKDKRFNLIPCVIGGKEITTSIEGEGVSPSKPKEVLYKYSLAGWSEVNTAIEIAKKEESSWSQTSFEERAQLLAKAAQKMRERRGDLIGVMMADGGKTILEGDPEVSEAIDFAEYYLRSALSLKEHPEIEWNPKGTILITPPWNFPVSIPAGGILAALAAGNCVLFKPAPEAVLSGWVLVNCLWDAGIPKNVLQFFSCEDNPTGSKLIADPRIDTVILTGATSTARLFMNIRPDLSLLAETGGKNALIVTALSDRDLAIKDLIHSAFGHGGQKCSAASLGILEAEVYDDPHFLTQLKDATESLKVGDCWTLNAKITPLIKEPEGALLKAFTTLEEGESWLVKPKQDAENPNLWSPGIKLGVKPGSFLHQTECFGPVLALMRAENLDDAIKIAMDTPYGLTSGISSIDKRELKKWLSEVEAGNLYINRSITGAIVARQPFGGCKASGFGLGLKAGGPNYVFQLTKPKQQNLPKEKISLPMDLCHLIDLLQEISFSAEELGTFYGSVANYAFWIRHFPMHYVLDSSKNIHDPLIGQDNVLFYKPKTRMTFRIQKEDSQLDILRIFAAALLSKCPLEVSYTKELTPIQISEKWHKAFPIFSFIEESPSTFAQRIAEGKIERIRLTSSPDEVLKKAAAQSGCFLDSAEVLASGRFELLHYLQEVALSYDYHRYGNLGLRER